MNKLKCILLVGFLFKTTLLNASQNSNSNDQQIKPIMQDFYLSLKALEPFIIDVEKFKNQKQSSQVQEALNQFSQKTEKLKKEIYTDKSDMSVKVQLLVQGLAEANETFKNGYKDYSYWVLKSSLQNCYSCHTSKNLSQTEYQLSDLKDVKDVSKASFLFMIRNYSLSVPLLKNIVTEYPKNNLSLSELNESVDKLLLYSVKVDKNYLEAGKLFFQLSQSKEIPTSLQLSMGAWSKYLTEQKSQLRVDLFKNEKAINKFLNSQEKKAANYGQFSQRKVIDYETSQILFQQLNDEQVSDKVKPYLLYALADLEKEYRMSLFDATSELYLKECIEKYSQDKTAKKCYQLYKEIKTLSFTGSEGIALPQSVINQFKAYEKLLKLKK